MFGMAEDLFLIKQVKVDLNSELPLIGLIYWTTPLVGRVKLLANFWSSVVVDYGNTPSVWNIWILRDWFSSILVAVFYVYSRLTRILY